MQVYSEPVIKKIPEQTFIGIKEEMTFADDGTQALFKKFMSNIKNIPPGHNQPVYDLKIYPSDFFMDYNPSVTFTKWALIKYNPNEDYPDTFEKFELESGLYAIFKNEGAFGSSDIFTFIFTQWLPNAPYELENRPHFDILESSKEKDKPKEIIYIPIQPSLPE